ncbi:hypothetical protein HN51_059299 [Arachis hypogaea]|uniref:Phytosulfokine-beta n=1 Tax=Arachis hypogaea TaxID=3818 RepID=A0A444X4X6_ARAHY|nr:hypothetical protein Ahy_B10g104200 [Arachis hypogaea]
MRPSKSALFLFLILIIMNGMICVVQGEEAVNSEVVVVDSGSGGSATIRRGGCDLECKEGNDDGSQEAILENEDYVYTNSLP